MCGISVCIGNNKAVDRKRFEAMTDVVVHRGPDDRGTYYDKNVAMGHRRLSIIDLSADGHQPFELVDGYVLVFNGEIYNYLELKQELSDLGYVFRSKCDTEIIVQAYREWGEDCVSRFNGMWAFALYDKEKKTVFCSRDRFGVKPFYYTESEGFFLAASEIKQFFEVLDNKPQANEDRLRCYIVRGDTDTPPYTLFKDIYQLPPGANLIYDIDKHEYEIKMYYTLDTSEDKKKSYEESCQLFRRSFTDSVRLRLRSDVPVGYFLSGGLDSSSIVCVADRIRSENPSEYCQCEQHTISACYKDKEYDEQEYIDAVSEVTRVTVHKVFPDTDDMWTTVDRMLWHMDEPLFDLSMISQWNVCKAAGEYGLKVILDGQGSDEQLAGYSDFYTVLFVYLIKKFRLNRLRTEIDAYIKLGGNKKKESGRKLVLSAIKDCFTPKALDRFVKRISYEYLTDLPFDRKMLKETFRNIKVYPRRHPREFIKTYMTDELVNILHNLDRKTMAFSVEARDPFLDYRLVEDIYKMPFDHKIRNGMTKAVLRDGMSGIIPDKVRNRTTKLAFDAPVERWMNEDRSVYRKELESSLEKLGKMFDTDRILRWYDGRHRLSVRDCNIVWRILITGRWIEMFGVEL